MVKCFSKEDIKTNEKHLGLLKSEIEILRKISHESIAKFHEVHESKNKIYLIFEYLEGGTLSDLHKTKSLVLVKSVIKQIFTSLLYLKQQGIVHRDIKPDNILFSSENGSRIKLIDLGLSCYVNDQNPATFRCGTPGYIAPEILNTPEENISDVLINKVDVFSLGAIFFKFLFGKKYFSGECTGELLRRNRRGVGERKMMKVRNMILKDRQALDLVSRMLEVDSEKRISIEEALLHPFLKTKRNQTAGLSFSDVVMKLKRENLRRKSLD